VPIVLALFIVYALLGWWLKDFIADGRSDFISYYTAAQLIKERPNDLYDLKVQAEFQDQILASLGSSIRFRDGLLAYNHPPFEIVWFAPLASLSYLGAFSLWALMSGTCFAAGIWLLTRDMNADKASLNWLYALNLLFLPLLATLFQGQDSGTLFLFWVLTYRNLRQGKDAWAGLWLSLVLQKFQLLVPSLLLLLLKRRWKALAGFMGSSAVLLLVSWMIVGLSGLESYARLLVEMSGWIERKGIYPSQMHNLRGQFYAICYQTSPLLANGLAAAASLALLVLLWNAWKGKWEASEPRFGLKFSLLVTISVLVSPHLNFHDLAVLLLPGLMLQQAWRSLENTSVRRWLRVSLWTVGFPVMLTTLMIFTQVPIQLSVWGITGMSVLLLWSLKRQTEGVP
jgi:hypothetical protein